VRGRAASGRRARGFTYIGLLLAIAMLGAGLAAAGVFWSTGAQREREAELLFAGAQYRAAIESYASRSRALRLAQAHPPRLEDLVADDRGPVPARHLRRLYPDPITGRADWGLVRDARGGIVAVHSLSPARPLKVAGFPPQVAVVDAKRYAGWRFGIAEAVAAPTARAGAVPIAAPEAGAALEVPPAPPPPAWVSPAQLRRDMAERSSDGCERILRVDLGVCARVGASGDAGDRAACESSAQARNAACFQRDGSQLPPLLTRAPPRAPSP
jgi:type II secretory pathway pseudopilin PulG